MLCALVVRGINSMLKAVICRFANCWTITGFPRGFRKLINTEPDLSNSSSVRPSSLVCGGLTLSNMSASLHNWAESLIILAPAAS